MKNTNYQTTTQPTSSELSEHDMSTQPLPTNHTGAPPDLNATQRDIMSAIKHLGGSPHGAAIKEFLEGVRKDDEFPSGVLYPGLNSLINKGILDKRERDGRSNEYYFTPHGEEVYRDYVAFVDVG